MQLTAMVVNTGQISGFKEEQVFKKFMVWLFQLFNAGLGLQGFETFI